MRVDHSNADVVREAFAAADRRDKQALFGLLSPTVEWHMAGLFPDQPPVRAGREGIWDYALMLFEQIEDLNRELAEVEEVGEQVVARYHVRGRSRETGDDLDFEFTLIARVKDGKIVSGRNYEDHDEAVTDAQLSL
ncbi:MAG: SnoaL-like domain [Solirubrobacteraceae bacterium]|nr:SnoaL-like domain [Solirubrobacteraceae bacterium]